MELGEGKDEWGEREEEERVSLQHRCSTRTRPLRDSLGIMRGSMPTYCSVLTRLWRIVTHCRSDPPISLDEHSSVEPLASVGDLVQSYSSFIMSVLSSSRFDCDP
jgi:hypothetical protein